jgi:hypothetical protein
MAKQFRCPRPVNRLVMHRARGLVGPFYQNTGRTCLHSNGFAFSPGGALAGIKAILAETSGTSSIRVTFNQPVDAGDVAGVGIIINGAAPVFATGATQESSTVWVFEFPVTINFGDVLYWDYTGSGITDASTGEPIPSPQRLPVQNLVVFKGDGILLEVGADQFILTEDDEVMGLET